MSLAISALIICSRWILKNFIHFVIMWRIEETRSTLTPEELQLRQPQRQLCDEIKAENNPRPVSRPGAWME